MEKQEFAPIGGEVSDTVGDVKTAGIETLECPSRSIEPIEVRTLPFMLYHREEIELFDDYHDEPLHVRIVLLDDVLTSNSTIEGRRAREKMLCRLAEKLPANCTLSMGLQVALQYGFPSVRIMPQGLEQRLTVKQRRWAAKGFYPQAGFSLVDADLQFDVSSAIATAMTLYDAEVVGSGSLHPKDHVPTKILGLGDKDLVYEVNRVFDFEYGVADWNHSLVPIRNEILIKVGAELRDLDPDAEYKRFVVEGHSYFLDFTFPEK